MAEWWEAAEGGADLPPGSEAWLVLGEALETWDRIGDGPGWERLRDLYRTTERVRHAVFPERALNERAARAREGFLAYRKDLVFLDLVLEPGVPPG